MKTGILYFTTCFHCFVILRHVDPFVRMLHIYTNHLSSQVYKKVHKLHENAIMCNILCYHIKKRRLLYCVQNSTNQLPSAHNT